MIALGYVLGESYRRWTSATEVRMQTLACSLCRVLGEALYSHATFCTLVLMSKHEYQTKASFNVNRKVTADLSLIVFLFMTQGVKDDSGKDIYPVTRTWSISKHAAGTIVYYYHEKNEDADRVFIPGPTNEHLQVYVRGWSMLFT